MVVNQLRSATTSVHPGMGANLVGDECSFRVWAPNAIAVSVCIWQDERMSQVALAPEPSNPSYWSVDVSDVVAGQLYQFSIVNKGGDPTNPGGILTRVDAHARQVEGAEDNARGIVVDWQQQWSEFATPKFADLIIYQAHVGSFAGLHDHLDISTYATFADFETKLGYIRELGFNALQLLPTEQVDGIDGEGYGATNLFAPHNGYGTPADLRSLVDAAHRHGLAVIFDVVYHHASTSHNHYWQYDGNTTDGGGIYFEDPFRYEPARDEDGRSFAHWKSEVQNFLLDHARMLLNEYRGDGLRFDMAHTLTWECTQHIITGLRENPDWRDKYFIAEWRSEQQDRWGKVIRELGFNAVWGISDPFAFIRAVNGENTIDQLKSFIGWTGFDRPWNFVRYLLGSHDRIADSQSGGQHENRYFVELCGGRDNWYARAKARLGWALNVAMPGTPMLFMGSECHHWGYWWPNPDGNLATSEHRFDWAIAGDPIGISMRNLVIVGGTVGAVGATAYLLSDRTNLVRADLKQTEDNNKTLKPDEKEILFLASLAPSGHNTQPWFVRYIKPYHWIIGNDQSKWLPAVDPTQRETMLSIGAFLQNLEYAAGSFGYACNWKLLAATNQDDGVMEVKLSKKVSTNNFDITKITSRRTVRSDFLSNLLKQEDITYFVDSEPEFIHYLPNTSKESKFIDEQTIAANRLQSYRDPAQQELANWIRFPSQDAEKYRDGLTTAGMEITGIPGWVVRNSYDKDNVMTKDFRERGIDNIQKEVSESAGWILITSQDNSVAALLETGRRMERLFLKVRERNIAIHPMTQILEEPSIRAKLNQSIGIGEHVQFILRTGYLKNYPQPVSLRRPIDRFIQT